MNAPTSPRVSVVIPTYNASRSIAQTIASVAAQTFRSLEVVIVDDTSSDNTEEIARLALEASGLPHTIVRLPENSGPAHARNVGVRRSRGEFVAFLDADDLWLPKKIERQLGLLDANPSARLCGCQAAWIDGEGNTVSLLFNGLPEVMADGWKQLLWDCYIATPCALVRRADLGTAPFNPVLRVGEDRDLWIRVARRGSVVLAQERLVDIRLSPSSYMASSGHLTWQYVEPMIEGHIRSLSNRLSLRDKFRARAKVYSDIGRGLCASPGGFWHGSWYLIRAIVLGHRPLDCARFLVFTAPGVKNLKRYLKDFLEMA
ncbi:MAG: glycosyltransferase family 2 protein [Alphaproteobacteria bacterium]|nr:glycosyltransferase family 2 protein [Alphaproteobacteria bacterium]